MAAVSLRSTLREKEEEVFARLRPACGDVIAASLQSVGAQMWTSDFVLPIASMGTPLPSAGRCSSTISWSLPRHPAAARRAGCTSPMFFAKRPIQPSRIMASTLAETFSSLDCDNLAAGKRNGARKGC